jgi:hypothetical protein
MNRVTLDHTHWQPELRGFASWDARKPNSALRRQPARWAPWAPLVALGYHDAGHVARMRRAHVDELQAPRLLPVQRRCQPELRLLARRVKTRSDSEPQPTGAWAGTGSSRLGHWLAGSQCMTRTRVWCQ